MALRQTVAGAALGLLAWTAQAPAEDVDLSGVCRDQIESIIGERFGHTVRDIRFRWQSRSQSFDAGIRESEAIVLVNECPGYHFFELNADDYACERQTYTGKVPRFAMYRSSGDGC